MAPAIFWDGEENADGLEVEIVCARCCGTSIGSARSLPSGAPQKDQRAIKDSHFWIVEACSFCGQRGSRAVRLLVP